MLRYLLDTTVLSQAAAKVPNASIVHRLETIGDQCALAAPVWHELLYGCKRLPAGKRREALEDYMAEVVHLFDILPYDERAAKLHATERERLERVGKTLPFVDGQIAAIAQVNELVLVTANLRDFTLFRGLKVVNWS